MPCFFKPILKNIEGLEKNRLKENSFFIEKK